MKHIIVLAWFFYHISTSGSGTVVGPFKSAAECVRIHTEVTLNFGGQLSHCWERSW